MRRDAQMAAADFDEQRVALRRPHRREVPDRPDGDADQPETQTKPTAPASVPFMIAMARGAPPSRIGSVSDR